MATDSDLKVLVTGCDIDGIPRGKVMNSSKFQHVLGEPGGFGFCNVIFAWDCHDQTYDPKTPSMLNYPGFSDIVARVDGNTYRRDPLTGIAHYLVDFYNPITKEPLPYCPRSLLRKVLEKNKSSFTCLTGVEFEFFNFKEDCDSLSSKRGHNLTPISSGMFGYSVIRTAVHQEYFDMIYDASLQYRIPLEIIHTETGPGVYEAALEYSETLELCDRAHCFKLLTKKIGTKFGITPCFMAKPYGDQPGCSGHLHFSLKDSNGQNSFSDTSDPQKISDICRKFVAGVLKGLPSIMALLAPTVNSYKRLNEAYWAPVTVSYGFESRTSAIRLISPPICSPSATRIEVRVPGADINCYLACAAICACGFYGIENNLVLPPLLPSSKCEMLPKSLFEAVAIMEEKDSLARSTLGDEFVDHYVATRNHELRLWNLAVTDWELRRYMEVI